MSATQCDAQENCVLNLGSLEVLEDAWKVFPKPQSKPPKKDQGEQSNQNGWKRNLGMHQPLAGNGRALTMFPQQPYRRIYFKMRPVTREKIMFPPESSTWDRMRSMQLIPVI